MTTDHDRAKASPEQIRYADLLFYGCWGGLLLLTVTYSLYAFGVMAPHIPLTEVSNYWGMSVNEYLHVAHVPAGWGWTSMVGKGDFLNFIGVAFLAGLTIIGYLTLIPAYWKKNDKIFVVICTLEVLVLSLAASGILGSAGH
jgi:hypothetical protein